MGNEQVAVSLAAQPLAMISHWALVGHDRPRCRCRFIREKADIATGAKHHDRHDGIVDFAGHPMPNCNATSITDTPPERGLLSDRGGSAVTLELGSDASKACPLVH